MVLEGYAMKEINVVVNALDPKKVDSFTPSEIAKVEFVFSCTPNCLNEEKIIAL